jgi:hypothetical protein
MRISFDMDGVLADMDSALADLAQTEFGVSATAPVVPGNSTAEEPAQPAADAAEALPSAAILQRLTMKQQSRLWQRVREVRNFWEALRELEPGVVRRLQELAYQHRWDILFVTQRPSTAGQTVQVQTQRWLHRHGFDMPSVFTTRGSRGRIAAAFAMDVHVDDRLENAVDIASDSRAWSILIWRDEVSFDHVDTNARKLNIVVARTVNEALDKLVAASHGDGTGDQGDPGSGAPGEAGGRPSLVGRLRQAFHRGGGR